MSDVKPWYLSRTIWASLVTVVLAIAGYLGIGLGGVNESVLTDSLLEIVSAISGIIAIIGRLSATTRIG